MASQKFQYELKIPKERIAVLIGKKGEVKKELEAATGTKINVDSREGDVFIIGKEALNLYAAREIIKAIGRGFNPEIAKLLLKADYELDVLNIEDYIKSKNDLIRMKARLIGTEGKARQTLERLTECNICIYGKTASVIGSVENIYFARKALEGLLRGAPHGNIYKWLEKQKKEQIEEEMMFKNAKEKD